MVLLYDSIQYFPSEVIEEEYTKRGIVGTYLLNDVDRGTVSRECQQQWEGRWTFGGGEGGGEEEDFKEKVGQIIPRSPAGWEDRGGGTCCEGCGWGTARIRQVTDVSTYPLVMALSWRHLDLKHMILTDELKATNM